MRELDSTRLLKTASTRLGRSYFLPAIILCLLVAVGFLFERPIRNTELRPTRVNSGTLSTPATSVAEPTSSKSLAQSERSEDYVWRSSINQSSESNIERRELYRAVRLNEVAQRKLLNHAPLEFTKTASQNPVMMTIPMPNGTFARFGVEESPVMADQLASQFPAIRTYRGRGLDDPTATTRFSLTPDGFHAIVLSSQGTVIVEPDWTGQPGQYVSYDQRNAPQEAGSFSCQLLGAENALVHSKQLPRKGDSRLGVASGTTLRTYRLAMAATAEFTQTFGGGTVEGALSSITTLVNAVNAIYERDLSIRLVLINNEALIINTNPVTDGYTSDDAGALVNQNQTILDQRIGAANYDLGMVLDGHVFAFQPGKFIFQGAANYQGLCRNGRKGTATTILRSTDPSTITATYVAAHELGHLLGALHTFNGTLEDCGPSRFAEVAYEPGSGSTIMGYRGGVLPNGTYFPLCASEELFSTDTYFHTASIEQITTYTTISVGSVCAAITETGNNPPNVDAGVDYTIPANTPFALTASANDAEGDSLTYCWEEFDLGAAGPPHTDNGNRPIFRSFAPTPNPTRTFPQLSDILSGSSTFGESLPTTNRTMTFRITVRDNHAGGGGVNTAAMRVNVVSNSGPFAVTQPSTGTAWQAGSTQTVTWNVANTSTAPINCANVRVLLSIDGGTSFPYTLASSLPNSGTATITLPNTPTSTARVKVEAVGNIFFNISLPNFTITPSNAPPTLLTEENTNRAIALDSVTFVRDPFELTSPFNFSLDQRTRVMLFAVGLELMPSENSSVVTAQAEDSAHTIYPLTVEYVGKVPNFNWLTQVNVKLPNGLGPGDILVSITVRGATSNQVLVGIR